MVSPSTRRGFSLTEILVVVVLIVILATILLVGGDYVYTHAMRTNCQHNMEQIWHACQMYATNRGLLPPAWDHGASRAWYKNPTLIGYLAGGAVVGCPVEYVAPSTGDAGVDVGLPTEKRETLLDTLRWLKRIQGSQGAWDGTNGIPVNMDEYAATGCFGSTGMALLAFLCAGRTDTSDPEFAPTVRTAIEFLMKSQSQFDGTSSDGRVPSNKLVGTTNDSKYMYGHSICTMALCDAAKMMPAFSAEVDGKQRTLQQTAQKAVDFLVQKMGTYGGFDYATWSSRTDMSIMAWCYQAIHSAMLANIQPTGTSWAALKPRIDTALNDMIPATTHQSYPQSPYTYSRNASGVTSPDYSVGEKRLYRMTAVSLLCRLYMGQAAGHPHVAAQLQFLTRTKDGQTDPEHVRYAKLTTVGGSANTDVNQYDIYIIYYLSLALHQLGASQWSNWVEGNPPRFLGYPDHLMALRVDKTASTTDDKWYSGSSSTVTDKGSWHYNLGC